MRETASRTARRTSPEGLRLGERLRQLRVAAGLTQTELAGDRFSKEYVSQIERGKTRPTEGTIEWLADRLGVDAGFLANGVATDERSAARRRARPRRGAVRGAGGRGGRRGVRAAARCGPRDRHAGATGACARAAAVSRRCGLGEHRAALELLNEARAITEAESFSDVERADVLFWLGGCRYQLNERADGARALQRGARARRALGPAVRRAQGQHPLVALALLAAPARLRSRARRRRARARARRRASTISARSAPPTSRPRSIADREGHWVLARNYAERAREAYAQLADRVHVSQLTNNLGGLNFLLGNTDQAVELLKESFAIALDLGRDADAGRAVSSLAQVHLRTGERRAGRGAGASRARAARRPRRLRRRGRQRAARARARAARAGPPRRGRGGVRRRRGDASASSARAATAPPPGSRAAIWQLDAAITNGGRAVPHGRRGATGCPLLEERKEVTT